MQDEGSEGGVSGGDARASGGAVARGWFLRGHSGVEWHDSFGEKGDAPRFSPRGVMVERVEASR